MNFSFLESFHQKWKDILVIGKTIERDNKKYYILGMTLSELSKEANLYIIEPYKELETKYQTKKGIRNQRRLLKEIETPEVCYLHCSDFYFGKKRLCVQGGTCDYLSFPSENYRVIQLFFDMISAGWEVPEWLKTEEWDNLQLVTLNIASIKRLPKYNFEMPITIIHRPNSIQHILEKTITLHIGKSRSFSFTDNYGEKVQCYINNVTLIDVWKETEKLFQHPKFIKKLPSEQLQQTKEYMYKILEENCPKGMYYIGIEYECSKDINLQFYTKQYLTSIPETHKGSSSFLMMRLKPDKKIGKHHLPLKRSVIYTPVSPDISKIPAELFLYFEKAKEWKETI